MFIEGLKLLRDGMDLDKTEEVDIKTILTGGYNMSITEANSSFPCNVYFRHLYRCLGQKSVCAHWELSLTQ